MTRATQLECIPTTIQLLVRNCISPPETTVRLGVYATAIALPFVVFVPTGYRHKRHKHQSHKRPNATRR